MNALTKYYLAACSAYDMHTTYDTRAYNKDHPLPANTKVLMLQQTWLHAMINGLTTITAYINSSSNDKTPLYYTSQTMCC